MFSGSNYAMELVAILNDLTGNGKFKMAASKLEIRVPQIATKVQVLYLCSLLHGGSSNTATGLFI